MNDTPGPRVSRPAAAAIAAGVVLGALLVLWVAASLTQGNQTANDLYVGGSATGDSATGDIAIGDLTEAEVRTRLESSGSSVVIDAITVDDGVGEPMIFSADQLGIGLDVAATTRVAMTHKTPLAPWSLLGSHLGKTRIDPVLGIDREVAATTLRMADAASDATEPTMRVGTTGHLEIVPGADGRGLDIEGTIDKLASAIGTAGPIAVTADSAPRPPTVSDDDATEFVALMNKRTEDGFTVVADNFEQLLPSAAVRGWLIMDIADGEISLGIDEEKSLSGLAFAFGPSVPGGTEATFTIVDGQVRIEGGEPAVTCCEPEASQAVLEAIAAGRSETRLRLETKPLEHGREWAESLEIVEQIGEFTTNYTAGQSRVTNIRRIAELTQGVVIEPGDTFSVNDFVGRRTTENGFVGAGVIYNGIYTEDVGGGISQYATTLFNAAFFGGLDFGEYQSHSLPIGRYPYGREATLSFPHPDLQIINNTPHGVLIWPTTTSTSITVRLYSTTYATGVQSGQTIGVQGTACDRVTTFRTLTYADGRTEQDSVVAVYRPGEGFNCQGEPTDPSFATTTTVPIFIPPIFIPPVITAPPATPPPPPTTAPPTTPPPTTAPPTTAPPTTPPPTTAPPTTSPPTT